MLCIILACCCCLLVVQGGKYVQVFYQASDDISYLDYDAEECETGLQSFFHDMSQMEMQDNWARCWSVTFFQHLCLHCSSASVTLVIWLLCNAWHCTALHCTALHCTALHCTAPSLGTLYSETTHLFAIVNWRASYQHRVRYMQGEHGDIRRIGAGHAN